MSTGRIQIKNNRTMDGHTIYEGMLLYDEWGKPCVAKYRGHVPAYESEPDCDYEARSLNGGLGNSDASDCFAELRWAEQYRSIRHKQIHEETTQ